MLNATNRTHTGHESLLNHFARSGKKVSLVLTSGKEYTGRVKAFDRYTISLEIGVTEPEKTLTIVVFKHAIQFFFSTEK